jgi:nitrous oxide reductase accessory protein NosL
MKSTKLITTFLGAALACGVLAASADGPRPPGEDDRCAVCGMFVHKYPNWVATIVFDDGGRVFFDGPKDMFRYLLELEKYAAGDREIAGVWVTEYYRVQFIDAQTAVFVTGSDVMGPMGGELVPFATRDEAEAFALDHRGEEILEFAEVTSDKVPR